MKKLYLLAALALAAAAQCPDAYAGGDTRYYAKCTVQVAEDSKGLGTVYLVDEDGVEIDEAEGSGIDSQIPPAGGAKVTFHIVNEPADGYIFANFTDQSGTTYKYDLPGSNAVTLVATSEDEANPSVFNLQAHFVKEGELPKDNLAEVLITTLERYGTFMSPVDTEIPSDFVAYKILEIKDAAVMITPFESTELPAFTPVLLENVSIFNATISATYSEDDIPEDLPSMTSGLLIGTLDDMEAPIGSYVLEAYGEDDTTFTKVVDSDTTVPAFRAYLSAEDASNDFYPLKEAEPVSVGKILDNLKEGEIYDIEGRKLDRLQKGINIVGGTKVIVK